MFYMRHTVRGNPPRRSKRSNGFNGADFNVSGFSLIELLVVVAILAILAAIAIPLFLNQKAKARQAQVQTDTHNLMVEMTTQYPDAPAVAIPDTGATLAAKLTGWKKTNGYFYVYPNCTVETSATSLSPGNYVLRGQSAPGGTLNWDDVWLYDSKTQQWFLNDATRYNNVHTVCNPTQPRANL